MHIKLKAIFLLKIGSFRSCQTHKDKLTMSTKKDNSSKEFKEPDYNEDEGQLEEKQEEENRKHKSRNNNKSGLLRIITLCYYTFFIV
jgi:hypothetical protein